MVSIDEYATVGQEATLLEACQALEEAQEKFNRDRYRHRAIIILDKKQRVVGKLSQLDVIKALEPKYDKILDSKVLSRSGFSPGFLKSMVKEQQLWVGTLEDICRTGAKIKVKNVMYTPQTDEYVTAETTMDQAIHQLVMGRHQSLLVTSGQKIVGILRLSDVFKVVCSKVRECSI